MTSRPRSLIVTLLILTLCSALQCRRATGVESDPLVREAEEALVGYLQIDTSNPPGNETAGARYLQKLLAKEGIEARLIGSDPARQSLYARLESGTNEKALLLMHHIDVVPAVASDWTQAPFSGARSGGYIWGRGALDIKAFGIAELMAVVDLKRRRVPLQRDVVLLAVADEELGGLKGTRELLEKHPELFADIGFVLNEGGYNETLGEKVTFWGIEVQQKVPLWLRLRASGSAGHGASPPDDGGAISRLARALVAIEAIDRPYRLTPDVADYFHEAGKGRPEARGEIMRTIAEPLDRARIERELAPGYRALLRDTLVVTRFSAGSAINIIPPHATADIDIRLLPGSSANDMLRRVTEAAGKLADVEVLLTAEPTPSSPADTELFRVLARELESDEPKSRAAAVVGAGTSDSRFFRARGITAYGISPFKLNYYDADGVHAVDERIRARFFGEGVRLTKQIVAAFCAAR